MFLCSIVSLTYSELNFTDNIAHFQGGAIHQALGGGISVASHSVIRFINNSANQGGALYLSESATLKVGNDSVVIFAISPQIMEELYMQTSFLIYHVFLS